MLNSHGHWSLGHWPFVPETPKKKENTFFQKFLEIVCIWKMSTGKEKCIWKLRTGKEKCIWKVHTGKEIYSQILYRKRKWLSNIGTQKNCVFSSLLLWKGVTRVIRVTDAILPKVPQLISCDFIKMFCGYNIWEPNSFPVQYLRVNFLSGTHFSDTLFFSGTQFSDTLFFSGTQFSNTHYL